jgi:D-apiose dehydrogenase
MRGAAIGCGFFAQNHLNAWRDMTKEGVEFVTVCTRDRAKAETTAGAFDVPNAYDDAGRVLSAERLDYFRIEKRLAILDVGTHVLDLPPFFLGDVERVSCEAQRRSPLDAGEDTATMLLRHRSGAVSVVECTYETRLDPDLFRETEVAIECERGSVRLGPGYIAHVTRRGGSEAVDLDAPLLKWSERPWHVVQESVLLTQRAIIAAWRAGQDAETNGPDNLRTLAVVEAAYQTATSGRAVVPLDPDRDCQQ